MLDPVREDDHPHAVVVLDREVGEHGGDLGDNLALLLLGGAESARRADVDYQHDGQLPLFPVLLDERARHPSRHVPVDVADVVARRVLAHLLELHAPALEGAVVLAREGVGHQALGPELDGLDPRQQLR